MNMRTHRHHLLEIILWPNGDGTFKTILNSRERLQRLGIYYDYKLTIPLTMEEHFKLHAKYMSEEHRKKISEAQTGENNHFYGKHLSEEHRRKLSEAKKGMKLSRKGKVLSEETRRKMSEARKGMTSPRKGKVLSEETRRKISEAAKARWARHAATKLS